MSNFPPLRIGLLQGMVTLKESFDADPSHLDAAPYDDQTKGLLRTMFAPKVVEKEVIKIVEKEAPKAGRGRPSKDVKLNADDQEKVQKGIQTLMKELEALGVGESTLDTNARIQIIKTKAGLHRELLQMQERVFNIKTVSQFQEVVIAILEDLIDEKDREIFLARIAPYRD
jgi:hypothetical protein